MEIFWNILLISSRPARRQTCVSAKARLTRRQQGSASAGEFQEEGFQTQMTLWRLLLESALCSSSGGCIPSLQTCVSACTQTSVNKPFQADVSSTVKGAQWNLILGFCSFKGIFTKALCQRTCLTGCFYWEGLFSLNSGKYSADFLSVCCRAITQLRSQTRFSQNISLPQVWKKISKYLIDKS